MIDYHTHTTYSDGAAIEEMVAAAANAGLDGVGLSDHCCVYTDPFDRSDRYDFEETYLDRRAEIESLRESYDIEIYDGVEMNYDPNYEDEIRQFLEEAAFDYAIGSVHYAGEYYIAHPSELAEADDETKRDAIETYVEWQCQLVESGLFDILGHLDIPQRPPSLRGHMAPQEYRRLAAVLSTHSTVPEMNAGRLDRSYATVHPHPDRFECFEREGVELVLGTDSHAPDQLSRRVSAVRPVVEEASVTVRSRLPAGERSRSLFRTPP